MRIRTLRIKGFQSFRDAQTIDLTGRDLVAVVGENHVGKSTVVDALTWALFGTSRGSSVNDVIHRGSQFAQVDLEADLADGTYRITRTRTRRGRHEVLLSVADPSEPNGWRNLGEKHSSVTDSDIIDLIGMNAETSQLTWLIGQGKTGSFCEMKPTDRRAALAKAFGLGVYADLAEEADGRRREARAALDRATWSLEQAQARAEQVETTLGELGDPDELQAQASRAWDEAQTLTEALAGDRDATARSELTRLLADHERALSAYQSEQARLELSVASAQDGVSQAEQELAEATEAEQSLSERTADIEEARAEIDRLSALEAEHTEAIAAAHAVQAEASAQAQAAESTKKEMTERLDALAAGASGGRCIVCSSELTPEHAAKLEAETRRALDVATDALDAHIDRIAQAATDLAVAEQSRESARARTAAITGPLAQADRDLAVAQEVARRVPAMTQAHEDAVAHLADVQAELDSLDVPVEDPRINALRQTVEGAVDEGSAQAAVEQARQRARELEAAAATARGLAAEKAEVAQTLEDARTAQKEAADHLEVAATLVDAFRPSGIPAMILAGVVTELNTEANTVMDATGDDGLRVRVSTQRVNAKGTTSEAVMVYAVTAGGEVDYATLSGSEKFRVALAVRLGLARCIARRTGTPVRTIVLDEGWGALDEPTRQAVSGVLASLAGQFGVITVSHVDDVKASFPALVHIDASTGTSVVDVRSA